MKVAVEYSTPIEVANALAEIGIPEEVFREIALDSEAERDRCTDNDPPSAPGFYAWAKRVRGLRDKKVPDGWAPNDDGNFSTIERPDGLISIAVATGDGRTGWRGYQPRTKYPKGPRMVSAIERNSEQGGLFGDEMKAVLVPSLDRPTTWVWLCNRVGDTLYSELSLPDEIAPDGQVVGWARRIFLQPIVVEPDPGKLLEDEGQDFDIEVVAK